ncbi:hypothetical protein [Terricaulis silvestris]|uniref:Lipoprotein n=1 Tax=Terricaulis silvestris TaxID=2686094 RepID=A0A6I6MUB7_9CAUL|nr:hypothetical protein [Terricaulis silvestris]QGZ94763.1 hypothetical protein DSM104635_01593 [Terricaulis silvestris]
MKTTHLMLACAITALAACGQTNATTDPITAPAPVAEAPAASSCAVIANRNWTAHVNAMPGPGAQRTLIVTGEVDLPTPGYAATLDLGPADRSAIPVQQLIVTSTAPSGIVAQVVTPTPVRYEGPAIAQQYRAVRIMCGGQQLAEITDIVTAQ